MMFEPVELYVNRIQLSRFLETNYPEIYNNIGYNILTRLKDKSIIQKLADANIIREMTRRDAESSRYNIPLIVKAIPIIGDGIYLIDEYMYSRNDKVSILGGHMEASEVFSTYSENYIKSELVREIREETTMAGRRAWYNLLTVDKSKIAWNIQQCGLPVIDVSDVWYCDYIELNGDKHGAFTIYIPIMMGYDENPKLIRFRRREYVILRDLYNRGNTQQIIREFNIPSKDDVRLTGFDNVIEPIFGSMPDILRSWS